MGQFGFCFFLQWERQPKLTVPKTAWWIHCTNSGRCEYCPVCVDEHAYAGRDRSVHTMYVYVRMYVCAVLYRLYCRTHASHYCQLSHHTFKTPLHMYVRACVLLWGTKFTNNWLLFMYVRTYVRIFFQTNCYLKFASSNTDWVYRYKCMFWGNF